MLFTHFYWNIPTPSLVTLMLRLGPLLGAISLVTLAGFLFLTTELLRVDKRNISIGLFDRISLLLPRRTAPIRRVLLRCERFEQSHNLSLHLKYKIYV